MLPHLLFQASVDIKFRALASLGAIITVLSLTFDTFSQSVLTTGSRLVPSSEPTPGSSLPRALAYDSRVNISSGKVVIIRATMIAVLMFSRIYGSFVCVWRINVRGL